MIVRARWVLPIDGPPLPGGWVEVSGATIVGVGSGPPPGEVRDLGNVAILPGLVNAHTHLELSWMAGLVPPAASMDEWIRGLLARRRTGAPDGATIDTASRRAIADLAATGTVLVGDISNTLSTYPLLVAAGMGGVLFHELLGFGVDDPVKLVDDAVKRLPTGAGSVTDPARPPLYARVVAHAPYSVSPALFREIARRESAAPLSVHLGESPEEMEFLRTGRGPLRRTLEDLGVWTDTWRVPLCDPVEYVSSVGYLASGMLAVHATHLSDDGLARLRRAGAVVVTCPRSNAWVGAGLPRVSHFYASRVPVAIGTDSLASTATLNMFDELAELRRIAPGVAPSALLESATRIGAEALGFGQTHGTITPGKAAALVAVEVPADVTDVEEYLVGGVAPSAVRRLS